MFSTVKIGIIAALLLIGGFAVHHIMGLKADIATHEMNAQLLSDSITEQTSVIQGLEQDIELIQEINIYLGNTIEAQKKDLDDLNERFNTAANGRSRDFGAISRAKPKTINRIINKASKSVNRCFELAMGANLKDEEKNNECKELVNSLR